MGGSCFRSSSCLQLLALSSTHFLLAGLHTSLGFLHTVQLVPSAHVLQSDKQALHVGTCSSPTCGTPQCAPEAEVSLPRQCTVSTPPPRYQPGLHVTIATVPMKASPFTDTPPFATVNAGHDHASDRAQTPPSPWCLPCASHSVMLARTLPICTTRVSSTSVSVSKAATFASTVVARVPVPACAAAFLSTLVCVSSSRLWARSMSACMLTMVSVCRCMLRRMSRRLKPSVSPSALSMRNTIPPPRAAEIRMS